MHQVKITLLIEMIFIFNNEGRMIKENTMIVIKRINKKASIYHLILRPKNQTKPYYIFHAVTQNK